jgi:hypothetical protein
VAEFYGLSNRPKNLKFESEEKVGADMKRLYTLHCVVERVIAEIRGNKATGDGDVPGDLVKLFRKDSLSTVTQQINNIYIYMCVCVCVYVCV